MGIKLWQLLGLMRECEFIDVYVNGERAFNGQVFKYAVMDCEAEAIVRDFEIKTESSTISIVKINCR